MQSTHDSQMQAVLQCKTSFGHQFVQEILWKCTSSALLFTAAKMAAHNIIKIYPTNGDFQDHLPTVLVHQLKEPNGKI